MIANGYASSLSCPEVTSNSAPVYTHPRLIADGAQEQLEALNDGQGAGSQVTLRPAEGQPFVIFSPSLVKSNNAIVAEPWGIESIPEPAGLRLLRSTPAEIADVGVWPEKGMR